MSLPPLPEPKHLAKVPDGQTVVGIVEHQGHVIVATTGGVYRLYGDTLLPLRFVPVPDATDGQWGASIMGQPEYQAEQREKNRRARALMDGIDSPEKDPPAGHNAD